MASFTFGGLSYWIDRYTYAGWRLQQNLFSKKFRVLDPHDVLRFKGTQEECLNEFQVIRRDWELKARGSEIVLVLPGLARTHHSMKKIVRGLLKAGFEAVAVSYPSRHLSLEEHVKNLHVLANNLTDDFEKIHLVGHSLGGIVARSFAGGVGGALKPKIGRIVQIVSPNNGSKLAKRVLKTPLLGSFLGPVLEDLTPDAAQKYPAMSGFEYGLITAGRGRGKGYNPWLKDGDNDGILYVPEMKIAGVRDELMVLSFHSLVMQKSVTVDAVMRFIKTGRFKTGVRVKKDDRIVKL